MPSIQDEIKDWDFDLKQQEKGFDSQKSLVLLIKLCFRAVFRLKRCSMSSELYSFSYAHFIVLFLDSQVDKAAIVDIFRQVVEGVRYIHSQSLLHRDLKVKMFETIHDMRYRGSCTVQFS